jgi:hypothetical protein
MKFRTLPILVVSLVVLLACGAEREATESTAPETPAVETAPPGKIPPSLSGMYEIKGTTTVIGTKMERGISGTVILAQQGSRYTTTFSLETTYPTETGPVEADVIGKGDGRVDGTTLQGTAETQIVMASVPGVDSGFAYIPRYVGPRIVSTTTGEQMKDGTIVIEITSQPAEGEDYLPTRTSLRGRRVARPGETEKE